MDIYSCDVEGMIRNANSVKDALLQALEKDDLLKKPAHEIGAEYVIVCHKPSWFGKFFVKIFGGDEKDLLRVTVVKVRA